MTLEQQPSICNERATIPWTTDSSFHLRFVGWGDGQVGDLLVSNHMHHDERQLSLLCERHCSRRKSAEVGGSRRSLCQLPLFTSNLTPDTGSWDAPFILSFFSHTHVQMPPQVFKYIIEKSLSHKGARPPPILRHLIGFDGHSHDSYWPREGKEFFPKCWASSHHTASFTFQCKVTWQCEDDVSGGGRAAEPVQSRSESSSFFLLRLANGDQFSDPIRCNEIHRPLNQSDDYEISS
jgi:hypothetical protein